MHVAIGLVASTAFAATACGEEEPPREWTDPATGHRVVRLSSEPGSKSLYFHQYPFSADGKKMVFTSPSGIDSVNLETREVEHLVDRRASVLVTGRKTGDVYYISDGAVHAVDFETHDSRKVARLPDEFRFPRRRWRFEHRSPEGRSPEETGSQASERTRPSRRRGRGWGNITINADETLIVGIGYDPNGETQPRTPPTGQPLGRLGSSWSSGLPRLIFTIDVATGEKRVIHRCNDWLNHLQCSPTDPGQIMFCHEGPWHLVDRIWTIRADGSCLTNVHPRTIDMEIAGHEFFSHDGKMIWYDLQTPRSLVFWLAGYDLESGARTWYHLQRCEWSVHYNISPDGKLFCGDGGGPSSVASRSTDSEPLDPPGNGQWMYLFRPKLFERTGLPEQAATHVKVGMLEAERLVDLSKHDYDLEPNGVFTPDGKWIVFRSNMHGPPHVYAVEVARANESQTSRGT